MVSGKGHTGGTLKKLVEDTLGWYVHWGYTGGMDEEGGHTGMVNENTLVVKGREGTGVVSRRGTH